LNRKNLTRLTKNLKDITHLKIENSFVIVVLFWIHSLQVATFNIEIGHTPKDSTQNLNFPRFSTSTYFSSSLCYLIEQKRKYFIFSFTCCAVYHKSGKCVGWKM
jgi:hypothetical protein